METALTSGEHMVVRERVIVAPASGRFAPADVAGSQPGGRLDAHQVIGTIESVGHATPVHSPFEGSLEGLLAHAGERVREGQPVAWLRLA